MKECRFCQIRDRDFPGFIVWENDEFFALLDAVPFRPGHTLLVTKRHIDDVFKLGQDEYLRLFSEVQRIKEPILRATGAKRLGVAIEGLSVPHAHVHLVPIDKQGDLNPKRAERISDEELSIMCEKIKQEIIQFQDTVE